MAIRKSASTPALTRRPGRVYGTRNLRSSRSVSIVSTKLNNAGRLGKR